MPYSEQTLPGGKQVRFPFERGVRGLSPRSLDEHIAHKGTVLSRLTEAESRFDNSQHVKVVFKRLLLEMLDISSASGDSVS